MIFEKERNFQSIILYSRVESSEIGETSRLVIGFGKNNNQYWLNVDPMKRKPGRFLMDRDVVVEDF